LPDGRFLVVEDEKARPFSLVTIRPDGQASSTPLLPPEGVDDAVWKLDDLEALALDRARCRSRGRAGRTAAVPATADLRGVGASGRSR